MSEIISPAFAFVKDGVFHFSRRIRKRLSVIICRHGSRTLCGQGQQRLLKQGPRKAGVRLGDCDWVGTQLVRHPLFAPNQSIGDLPQDRQPPSRPAIAQAHEGGKHGALSGRRT